MDARLDKVSRKLTQILRHQIVEYGLQCDAKGFVSVASIFTNHRIPIDKSIKKDELLFIVSSNSKKRLELEERNGKLFIRAVQGHNNEVGAKLVDEEAFEVIQIDDAYKELYHGTEDRFVSSIMKTGLLKMERKHIHMVSTMPRKQQLSGFKVSSNTIIVINMKKAMEDGIVFLRSANNVILSEGIQGCIPPKYITRTQKIVD